MTETSRPDAYVAYGLIFCIPNIAVASSCASTLTNTQLRRTFWRRISGNLVSPHTGQITQSNARTNARARIHTHAQPQRTSKGSANITGQTNASHTATIHGFSADRFPLPTPSRLCCTFQHDFSSFWLFPSENHGKAGARHWWQATASLRLAAARPIMLFCCTSDRVAALLSQACRACLQRSVFDATRL